MGKKRTRYDGRSGRGSPSSTSSPPFRRSPYAVLNLSEIGDDHRSGSGLQTYMKRDVTQEEIREAYKRLSLLFHPDKQQVGEARGQAQEMFHELTNSCELRWIVSLSFSSNRCQCLHMIDSLFRPIR